MCVGLYPLDVRMARLDGDDSARPLVASESTEQLHLVTQSSASSGRKTTWAYPPSSTPFIVLALNTSLSSQIVEKDSDTDNMALLDSAGSVINVCDKPQGKDRERMGTRALEGAAVQQSDCNMAAQTSIKTTKPSALAGVGACLGCRAARRGSWGGLPPPEGLILCFLQGFEVVLEPL